MRARLIDVAAVLDRIVDAASRGVKVRVLCGGRHGISECDILDTFASLRVMRRAGAKIHKQKKRINALHVMEQENIQSATKKEEHLIILKHVL